MQFRLAAAEEVELSWMEVERLPLPTFQWLLRRIAQERQKERPGTKPLEAMVKSFEVLRRVKAQRPPDAELTHRERIEARRRRMAEEAAEQHRGPERA